MNFDNWLQWPTKSTDPLVNLVVLALLGMLVVAALATGAVILVPIAIVLGIAKGVHWYLTRPIPTAEIVTQTEQRVATANFPSADQFMSAHMERLLDSFGSDYPAYSLYVAMGGIAGDLYKAEDLSNPLPPMPPANTIEDGRYRDQLIARMKKIADAPKTLEIINSTLGKTWQRFVDSLPAQARATPEELAQTDELRPFATLPLIDVLPNPGRTVYQLIAPFFAEEVAQSGLFSNLRQQLDRNVHEASGVEYQQSTRKLTLPEEHKGTPGEIVSAYLRNTPFEALFYTPVPFSIPMESRFEHTHIVAGSGHGKTQFLQHQIFEDLSKDNPPSLVIIDSQGEMLGKIQRLALFNENPERLIIIDPEQYSPALNMFDTTNTRAARYSALHREQLEAGVIELYNYIFASIAAEMTSRQSTAFAFVARLMLAIPGATIHTLRELMEDPAPSIEQSPFRDHIEKLEPTARAYFQNQFFTKRYSDLKQQIARRLYGVLSVPAFDRMFSAKHNRLDMFEAMQAGKVVLVNTSKSLLKSDASALFGRYVIALVIRAVYERVASPNRHPTFLIVDEASEYFDENIQTLLEQARKFNVGLVLAHQHLDQLSTSLRSAISANTAIKLAGGVNDRDARALAPDMRTTAEFITDRKKQPRGTQFACYVRNYTEKAVSLDIPFGTLEAAPQMTDAQLAHLVQRNKARYAADPPQPVETSPEPPRPVATGPATSDKPATGTSRPSAPRPPQDDWRS